MEQIKFAMVKFDDTPYQQYCFLTDDTTLAIGDLVVVETIRGTKLAKFTGYVSTFPTINAEPRWIVQKVDMTKHRNRSVKSTKELINYLKYQKLETQCNELMEQVRGVKQEMAMLKCKSSNSRCYDIPDF